MKNILLGLLMLITFLTHAQQKKFHEIKEEAERYFANLKKESVRSNASNKEDEGEGDGDYNRYKRWEWWAERHLDVNGFVANSSYFNNLATETLKSEAKNGRMKSIESIGGNWQNLSNAPYSTAINVQAGMGRINCIVEIPGTLNLLVGTAGGGIWKGVFSQIGYNWIPLSDGIPQMGVSDIVVNPNDVNDIYILTGEGYGGSGGFSIGILKSSDGGANWKKTALDTTTNANVDAYKLIADPTNFEHMCVASNKGIFITQNAWATKQRATFDNNQQGGLWYDIKFKPNDGNIIYASSVSGIWRSQNGGATFQNIYNIPNGANNDASQRVMLGVTPANVNLVYAIAGNSNPGNPNPNSNTGFVGLYASTNSGNSFQLRSSSPNILSNETDGSFGSFYTTASYALCMAVSKTDANRIFIGSLNVWESANGGFNWINRSDNDADYGDANYVHADIHFLSFGSYGNILCGNDGGFFNYTMNNNTWSFQSVNLNNTQFYKISIVNQTHLLYTGRVIYGGSQDNGQHRWRTDGFSKVYSGDGMDNAISSSNGGEVVVASQNGGLGHSSNFGASFSEPSTVPSEHKQGAWVTPLVQHCSVPDLVYVGYKNYYYSTDGGDDWDEQVTTGFVNPIIAMAQGNYFTLNQPSTNVVYCATNTATSGGAINRLFRFENDLFSTKQNVTGSFNNNFITSIATDPNNSRYVFVTLGGYDAPNKVFFSSDKGATWTNITNNLPNVPVNCIVLKAGGGSGIYIGTDIGVFHMFSYAGGQQWTLYSNKLPNVSVTDLELDVSNNEIFAATYGRGLWKSDLYTSCPQYVTHNSNSVGQEYYEASGIITTNATIQGGIGSKVTYNTGNEIVFSEGFFIKDGSAMYAYVSGCGNVRTEEQFVRKSADDETLMQVVGKVETPTKNIVPILPQGLKIGSQDKKKRAKFGIKTQKR